jgi:hypothetical protein
MGIKNQRKKLTSNEELQETFNTEERFVTIFQRGNTGATNECKRKTKLTSRQGV